MKKRLKMFSGIFSEISNSFSPAQRLRARQAGFEPATTERWKNLAGGFFPDFSSQTVG